MEITFYFANPGRLAPRVRGQEIGNRNDWVIERLTSFTQMLDTRSLPSSTMREAVDIALRRFVQSGRQKKLLDLYGTGGMRKDYDYKRARSGA